MAYFDAHLHIVPDDVFERARAKGVNTFFCNATSEADWQAVLDLSKRVLGVYSCLGVHPWYVGEVSELWLNKLERLLQQNPQAMIGEIGLDSTRPNYLVQKEIFYQQLQLASQMNRPVHIHCVKAWDDLLAILGQFKDVHFLIHRFSGDEVLVQKLRFLNGYFSVVNNNCLNVIPDNRVLVESDAPNGLKTPEKIPDLVAALKLNPAYLEQNLELFLGGR